MRTSLQRQEMSLIQERTLPSSPSPLYSSDQSKISGFMKGALGQPSARKHIMSGRIGFDNSRGLLQWIQSITFVSFAIDYSLHLIFQADLPSPGYLEGFTPVKSLGSTPALYILIPSSSMRFLPSAPLQHPTCLIA